MTTRPLEQKGALPRPGLQEGRLGSITHQLPTFAYVR